MRHNNASIRRASTRCSDHLRVLLSRGFAITFILMFATPASFPQCTVLAKHPVADVFYLKPSSVWMLYSDGSTQYITRSSDGGKSWKSAPNPTPIIDVFFLDRRLGWGVGLKSIGQGKALSYTVLLYVTKDGGRRWTLLPAKRFPAESPTIVTGILFLDREHGWLVGDGGGGSSLVYETSDGGETFRPVSKLTGGVHPARGISSDGRDRIWVYGDDRLFVSPDRGKSWIRQFDSNSSVDLPINTGWFFPNGSGVLGGGDATGVILSTTDAGKNWITRLKVPETSYATYFESVYFWDHEHGCMVGSSNSLFCTADGGRTWSGRDVLPPYKGPCSPNVNLFKQIVMTGSGRGWLRDNGDHLYQTTDGGQTWSEIDPVRVLR
jgi:photosystem II stability/assembly factor-like uncharacterized protein